MQKKNLTPFLLALGFMAACAKKDPVQTVINKDKDALSESSRDETLQQVRAKLGVDIAVDPTSTVSGYEYEGLTNRVIRAIARNADELRPQLQKVSRILVGAQTYESRVTGDSIELLVPVSASERDVVEFIKNQTLNKANNDTLIDLARRIHVNYVTDGIGLSAEKTKNISDRITEAVKQVDMSKYSVSILIADRYTIGSDGTLMLDVDGETEDYTAFFAGAIEQLRETSETLKAVNEQLGDVTVLIQTGVFTPDEYKTALANIKANVNAYKNADRVLKRIVVGKRFETDPLRMRGNTTALVDYRVTGDELVSNLSGYDRDYSDEITVTLTSLKNAYKNAELSISSPLPTANENVFNRLNSVSSELQRVMPVARAKNAGLRSLVLTYVGSKPSVSLTGSAVTVDVMSFEATDLESALADVEVMTKKAQAEAADREASRIRGEGMVRVELDKAKTDADQARIEAEKAKIESESAKGEAQQAKDEVEKLKKVTEDLKKEVERLKKQQPAPAPRPAPTPTPAPPRQ